MSTLFHAFLFASPSDWDKAKAAALDKDDSGLDDDIAEVRNSWIRWVLFPKNMLESLVFKSRAPAHSAALPR